MKIEVKTIKQENLHDMGKFKYYVLLENKELRKVINVAESTYNEVNDLLEGKNEAKLNIEK